MFCASWRSTSGANTSRQNARFILRRPFLLVGMSRDMAGWLAGCAAWLGWARLGGARLGLGGLTCKREVPGSHARDPALRDLCGKSVFSGRTSLCGQFSLKRRLCVYGAKGASRPLRPQGLITHTSRRSPTPQKCHSPCNMTLNRLLEVHQRCTVGAPGLGVPPTKGAACLQDTYIQRPTGPY